MTRNHRRLIAACAVSISSLAGAVAGAAPVVASAGDNGMTRISGVGVLETPGTAPCDDTTHASADYALAMSGDLQGCVYGYITSYRFHPSGTYQEEADEVFVGSYDGRVGSFELTEFFTAKFDPDTSAQIFGRCQHPIVSGSGTGDFTGVSGRLDFKDDVAAGTAAYRGHLALG